MSSYIRNLYYYRYFISVRDVFVVVAFNFFSHDETHQVTNNNKCIFIYDIIRAWASLKDL